MPPNLAKRGLLVFRDAPKIHWGVESDFRAARKAHPALLVEDLPPLKTLIKSAGYSFNVDEPLGLRQNLCKRSFRKSNRTHGATLSNPRS
jgi:hypothetical protein